MSLPKLQLGLEEGAITTIAGAASGVITAVFVCPLDVLKTRLQVQRIGAARNAGIAGGLAQIARSEGMAGLYQGLGPTLMALLPNWAMYFSIYNNLKTKLAGKDMSGMPLPASTVDNMGAAAGAGVATMLATNPLWVVKTRMQTQRMGMGLAGRQIRRPIYTSTFNALMRITREEGIKGLYSGLAPSTMGLLHVVIQFPLYELCKQHLADRHHDGNVSQITSWEVCEASSFAKMVASTITYPHEVVRSYMHVTGSGPLSGFMAACRTIWREDGMKGFYRGCATNLLRTTPSAALTFTTFELIKKTLMAMSCDPAGEESDSVLSTGLVGHAGSPAPTRG